ncbi:uncharacterized protein DUF1573 [Larkinella arboricola]|uniref:Uncharacterized protein DUF1573 n=1 Tax=Larkinella arboricola TaxID=643671 RepID=A0A327WSG8_LARAB|nr:DUF1573 domain-containing protein [Larkinella arboricola]RAJ95568.1 uncharacterized protein DUF1573 [Larkinella arboricola]
MKNFAIGLLLLLGVTACNQTQKGSNNELSDKMPKMVFADKGVYDFGEITEGDTVVRNFKFKNEGEFPLIINNINTSCGCTTPEWPKQPIEPGKEASIKVMFNSQGKLGVQNKTVTVYANTDPAYSELAFRVMVNPRADSNRTSAVQ